MSSRSVSKSHARNDPGEPQQREARALTAQQGHRDVATTNTSDAVALRFRNSGTLQVTVTGKLSPDDDVTAWSQRRGTRTLLGRATSQSEGDERTGTIVLRVRASGGEQIMVDAPAGTRVEWQLLTD